MVAADVLGLFRLYLGNFTQQLNLTRSVNVTLTYTRSSSTVWSL